MTQFDALRLDQIYEFCKEPHRMTEIMAHTGLTSRRVHEVLTNLMHKDKIMSIKKGNQVIRWYLSVPDGTWGYNFKEE